MAIQQTVIGLENNFRNKASVLSRSISSDNEMSENETSFLLMGTAYDMHSVRVHTRARSEREIPTSFIPDVIQAALVDEIGDDASINRDVTIGAMYTDDLPISGHEYSNIFIVVSWGMTADIALPRDPQINVEMYFGWRQDGTNMRIADNWHLNVDVRGVGPLRRKKVREKVTDKLINTGSGMNAGERIRDGLRPFFDVSDVRNWYVIPGSGLHNVQENNIEVKHDASFWVVE